MKEYKVTLHHDGEEYDLVFDLNAMEEIQKEYGTIGHWGDLVEPDPIKKLGPDGREITVQPEPDLHALIFGFTAMINEGIDIKNDDGGNRPFLSHKKVGRIITAIGLESAGKTMKDLVSKSIDSGAEGKNG